MSNIAAQYLVFLIVIRPHLSYTLPINTLLIYIYIYIYIYIQPCTVCNIIMIPLAQTMDNTTSVEYRSVYENPERGTGRRKTCKLSDQDKQEMLRVKYKTYYYAAPEREHARKIREYAQKQDNANTYEFRKPNMCWLSEK